MSKQDSARTISDFQPDFENYGKKPAFYNVGWLSFTKKQNDLSYIQEYYI